MRRSKEEIFLFFLGGGRGPFQEDYPTDFRLFLKLAFKDKNIPWRQWRKNSKAHDKFRRKDWELKLQVNSSGLVVSLETKIVWFKSATGRIILILLKNYTNFQIGVLSDWIIFLRNKLYFATAKGLL